MATVPPPSQSFLVKPGLDPVNTSPIRRDTHALEMVYGDVVDSSTVSNSSVTLTDVTTGYSYTPTLSVVSSATTSRLVVQPDRRHEWQHSLLLSLTGDVKFTSGQAVGPYEAYFTVEDPPTPHIFFEHHKKELDKARVLAVTQPWERGWDDSEVANQRIVGMNNCGINSVTWLAGETPQPCSGAPADNAAASACYGRWSREVSGCISSGWDYIYNGTTASRDRIGQFLMAWIDNFDITPMYTGRGWPWDGIFWSLMLTKNVYAADLIWDQDATGFGSTEKARFKQKMIEWADILANQWLFELHKNTIGNQDQWGNTAIAAVAELVGDYKMRAWALDGSDSPSGWTTNPRPLDHTLDNIWTNDGSYVNEAHKENKVIGSGWTYGCYALNATAWHMSILLNSVNQDYYSHSNTHGNTLETAYDNYVEYIDGTKNWSDKYPGNTLGSDQIWLNAQKFFKGAMYYRSAKLRDPINQNYGTDAQGNIMQEPFGQDQIQYTGGNLDYLPAATAMGTDITAPNDPTGLSAASKGATWVELTWTRSAVTDEADIPRHYEIIDDGGPTTLATVQGDAGVVSGLTEGTAYTLRVKAVDYAGNKSTGATVAVTTDSA